MVNLTFRDFRDVKPQPRIPTWKFPPFSSGSASVLVVYRLHFSGFTDLKYPRPTSPVGGPGIVVPYVKPEPTIGPFNVLSGVVTINNPTTRYVLSKPPGGAYFFSLGRVRPVDVASLGGALSDFAIWSTSTNDPTIFLPENAVAVSPSVGATPWQRVSGTFTLGPNVRYIGVGGRYQGVPPRSLGDGSYQALTDVMVEPANIGGTYPSPFSSARQIRTFVEADRVNYCLNPSFWNDLATWQGLTAREPSDAVFSSVSGYVGYRSFTDGQQQFVRVTMPDLTIGKVYVARIKAGGNGFAVFGSALDADATSLSPQVFQSVTRSGTEIRYVFRAKVRSMTIRWRIKPTLAPGATEATTFTERRIRFSECIVEEKDKAGPDYFDGSTSPDHVWESGTTAGSSRSYYYQNRLERFKATQRILSENTPLGVGVALPAFGTLLNR